MSRDRNKCEVTEIERMAGEMDRLFAEAEMRKTVTKKHTSILKAEALYTAGYRKQSEGEWEFVYKKSNPFLPYSIVNVHVACSVCKYKPDQYSGEYKKYNYCPNCGAYMKGGAE